MARTSLYLDRQSETAHRTYRVYVLVCTQDHDHTLACDEPYAGKVLQPRRDSRWYAGQGDTHANGHTTRAQAVACLIRRVTQPRLETAR